MTRRDLPLADQAVQAGHAVGMFSTHKLCREAALEWNNETLIYLTVENEDRLEMFVKKLSNKLINYKFGIGQFREPDLDYHVTAIFLYDPKDEYRNLFKNLKMLG